MNSIQPQIKFEKATKSYAGNLPILSEIDLEIQRGEFLFLTGVSGAGKTTALKLIMGLQRPDTGKVIFEGRDITSMNRDQIPQHRRQMGMVFQDLKLLEKKTARENIAVPLLIKGMSSMRIQPILEAMAKRLHMERLLDQKVESLSGGEQQLVAIARAAIGEPKVILADEPTANLDKVTSEIILDALLNLNDNHATTIILATHDINLIKAHNTRTLLLKSGKLLEVKTV